jgi:hypothetical protein
MTTSSSTKVKPPGLEFDRPATRPVGMTGLYQPGKTARAMAVRLQSLQSFPDIAAGR